MEFLDKLNKALDYIEESLDSEINYDMIAGQACTSTYHFQRMFSFITGIPLSEYIRKRRLTLAAFDVIKGEEKIIDIALKYGYDSPAAFSRAFSAIHGTSPSMARKEGVNLKAYPRMTFQIEIKGENEMNYRIEQKGKMRIIGVKEEINADDGNNLKVVPEMWQRVYKDGTFKKLSALAKKSGEAIYGVCANFKDKGEDKHPIFDNYIATISDEATPQGMEELIIEPATYAIFETIGPMPSAIQETWKKIFSQWFPTSDYEFTNAPEFEYYTDGDTSANDYYSEIWIPVRKKNSK